MSQLTKKAAVLPALSVLSMAMLAAAVPSLANAGTLTGNIGVFSKYVFRGLTNAAENDSTAVQGGFDYTADGGLFLGYWGSNLDYSYDSSTGGASSSASGFENNFYGGYNFKAGDVAFSVGALQYYYVEVDDGNALEPFATATMGPVTLGLRYLAQDASWGNKGDMYWTVSAGTDLPRGFKLSGTLGYYMYEDNDSKEICTVGVGSGASSGCGLTQTDSDFRHLDLTLSHPIAKTGADMMVTYIIGGKDRTDTDQDNAVVFAIKYPFDL